MIKNRFKTDISDGGIKPLSYSVYIEEEEDGSLWVMVYNQGGEDFTNLNVKDLIKWVIRFRPEFIEEILKEYPIEKYKETRENPFLDPELREEIESIMASQKEL